ncbi:YHS domain-containing protein [Thermoanaerobacterium sp. DL9XJH110]|jgi:Cu+-exporting ATPase|uniref:YHS domain-containing protein n=1 Tax=Thermoanaerobacterium sp. DL9XJH110 TaxID=3386643 RepID=UPI003BB6E669
MESNILFLLVAAAFLFLMMRGGGCCGGHGGHGGHGSHGGRNGHSHSGRYQDENFKNDSENSDYAVDPVCGMKVLKNRAVTRQIDGKIYYFCSEQCANSFKFPS